MRPKRTTDHGAVRENASGGVERRQAEAEEKEEEGGRAMIYRGCELRCIAEVRAESDNHGGGWWYRGAASSRGERKTKDGRRAIKIDVSLSPARSFSPPRETVRHSITPAILSDG